MSVVVIVVCGEDLPSVCLVHDQNVVEDLPAEGADHPLAVGIHARRLGCAEQHLHLLGCEDSVEGVGVFAVTEEEAEGFTTVAQVAG